jgi:hypothetical protein
MPLRIEQKAGVQPCQDVSDRSIQLVLSDAGQFENPRSNDKEKEAIELNAA